MPIQEKCRTIDHKKIGPHHYQLTLLSPYISSHAEPGQFVNVKCSEDYDPLLRRPLSIHRISPEHKTFDLLYEVIGKGTGQLVGSSVGKEIDVLGPLGEGFKINPDKKIHLLVGGGMGVAPLLGLAEQITNNKLQKINALYVLLGAKTKELLVCENDFRKANNQVLVATDDGSYGKKGFISDLLINFIESDLPASDFGITTIYACGPRQMLKTVAEIAFQKKIDCQVSMEERMACGIGACKGCAIKTKSGYKMACKDGPVFESAEIMW